MAGMVLLAADAAEASLAAPPLWPQLVIAGLLLAAVVLLLGLVLNVNKMLSRLTSIRRRLDETRDSGVPTQLQEAIAQLQSMAVSLDRVAAHLDTIEAKVSEASSRQGVGGDSGVAEAVGAVRAAIEELRRPVGEIRDLIGKTGTERLADEVKRTLFNMGYDQVVIRTDLATLAGGDGKVQVEVARSGVKSKGFLQLTGGSVVETKISPTYEMFP
jgi:hypothetical protein